MNESDFEAEELAGQRVLRHESMAWAAATMSNTFVNPDLVIERAEQFRSYVENGVDRQADFDVTRNAYAVLTESNEDEHGYQFQAQFQKSKEDVPYSLFLQEEIKKSIIEPLDPIDQARQTVYIHVKDRLENAETHVKFDKDMVYVVWFNESLDNWKALLSTTLPDNLRYQLTYNHEAKALYVDTYQKIEKVRYTDFDLMAHSQRS